MKGTSLETGSFNNVSVSGLMRGKVLTFSTSTAPARNRFDYWQEIVCKKIVNVECCIDRQPKDEFKGKLYVGGIADVSLFEMHSDPMAFKRTKHNIASLTEDCILITMRLARSSKKLIDGQSAAVGVGDLSFYHCGREQQLSILENVDSLGLVVPVKRLADYITFPENLNARSIRRSVPIGGLLATQFEALARYGFQLEEKIQLRTLNNLLSTMAAALDTRQRRISVDSVDVKPALFSDIDLYIKENLGFANLCPEHVARVKNISIRYLYQIFSESGLTPSQYIRTLRLHEVKRCLRANKDARISLLADRYGFRSISSLSKAFRAEFGLSPREFQRASLSCPGNVP